MKMKIPFTTMLVLAVTAGCASAEKITGMVNAVNYIQNTVDVVDHRAQVHTVYVTEDTKLRGFDDLTSLPTGSDVQVSIEQDNGRLEARKIKVKS